MGDRKVNKFLRAVFFPLKFPHRCFFFPSKIPRSSQLFPPKIFKKISPKDFPKDCNHTATVTHEREFPIPGIPGNTGLQFPSRKSGMEFSTPIPVPEKGNGIFITVPVPKNWEWN